MLTVKRVPLVLLAITLSFCSLYGDSGTDHMASHEEVMNDDCNNEGDKDLTDPIDNRVKDQQDHKDHQRMEEKEHHREMTAPMDHRAKPKKEKKKSSWYQKKVKKAANNNCPELCPTSPLKIEGHYCHNFHIDIGLLYLQPTFEDQYPPFTYIDIRDQTVGGVNYDEDAGRYQRTCFNYAVGLTSSLGYFFKHDSWFALAKFDWLNASVSSSLDVSDVPDTVIYLDISFTERNSYEAFNDLYDSANDRYTYSANFTMYLLDILLSRGSYHTTYFSYEPFAGVKALWYENRHKISPSGTTLLNIDTTGYINPIQHCWGVGPMVGFNGEFHICDWLAIFTDSDIALLFGEAIEPESALFQEYDDGELTTDERSTVHSNYNCINYVSVRSVLGIKLSKYFYNDNHFVAVKLGYDVRSVLSYTETGRGFILNGLYTSLIWNF